MMMYPFLLPPLLLHTFLLPSAFLPSFLPSLAPSLPPSLPPIPSLPPSFQRDILLCTEHLDQLEQEFQSKMETLRETVQAKTAVPTAQVYVSRVCVCVCVCGGGIGVWVCMGW